MRYYNLFLLLIILLLSLAFGLMCGLLLDPTVAPIVAFFGNGSMGLALWLGLSK